MRNINGQMVCTCVCHMDGTNAMHCRPCCDFTYKKYFSEDGKFDQARYEALIKERENKDDSINEEIIQEALKRS